MTLIAGFHSHGMPVLIGDFLITNGDTVSGLRKKILLVAENFALAWTGHMLAADSVVTSLQSSLDLDAVTIEAVKAILTDPATSDLGTLHVSLICWVIDSQEQRCFRWNSSYPSELYFGTPMYDGAGDLFIEALTGTGIRDSSAPNNINPDRAVKSALTVTTNLVASEMLGPSTLPSGFGFAYEILLAKNHSFEYVDNILYFAVTHKLDIAGKYLESDFIGSIIKYQSHNNYTLVNIYDPGKKTHKVHIVSPVGQKSEEVINDLTLRTGRSDYCFPFPSQYYCVFVRFNVPNFESPPFVMIQDNNVPQNNRIFEVSKKNELLLRVNPDQIEWMYKTICDDQRGKGQ